METLFAPAAFEDILRRLDSLQPNASCQWGKMTPAQALEHAARALEMASGARPTKQVLMGKLIGWMFKSGFVGPKPFGRNAPTGPDFVIHDVPDFAKTKARLRSLLVDFHTKGEGGCHGNVHGFFGPMTGAEWGITQHKHLDHHLRQFGA